MQPWKVAGLCLASAALAALAAHRLAHRPARGPDTPLAAACRLHAAGHRFRLVPVIESNPETQVYLCQDRRARHELQRLRLAADAEGDWAGVVLVGTSGPGERAGPLVLFGDPELVAAYRRSLR